jgi:hypothetical protein
LPLALTYDHLQRHPSKEKKGQTESLASPALLGNQKTFYLFFFFFLFVGAFFFFFSNALFWPRLFHLPPVTLPRPQSIGPALKEGVHLLPPNTFE